MRAIWKGAISFGLVNIPVGLYSATRSANEIKFKLLRASDLSPIKYKRVAEEDGKEVPWEQIVKGYEYEKGEYVVVGEEDFKRVEITSNQTVDIKEFVELDKIDPMFFDQPYFLGPEKGGAKAYVILREALVLELMHFAGELADPGELNLPPAKGIGQKELTMAESLIDSMSGDWQPENYKDEYREALMHVIEEKIKSGGKAPARKPAHAKSTKVVDLVSVLQESLKQAQAGKKKTAKQRKAA